MARAAAVALLLLAFAAPAQAASVRGSLVDIGDREDLLQATVRFQARPGERNRVTLRSRGSRVLVTERGARLLASGRCRSLGRHRALCALSGGEVRRVITHLGDRGDRFADGTTTRTTDFVDGGAGRDDLAGGPGPDHLLGGAGVDRLRGGRGDDVLQVGDEPVTDRMRAGPGTDLLSFRRRTRPVRVSLERPTRINGRAAPVSGIEDLTGGAGDDRLGGDRHANRLHGGRGDDTLTGGAGADELEGGHGSNRLRAGPGADRIEFTLGDRTFDDVSCGPGLDRASANEAKTLLRPDCEVALYVGSSQAGAQPVRVTSGQVIMRLPCAIPGFTDVRLVTAPRRPWYEHGPHLVTVARGHVPTGGSSSRCRTRLRLTAAGRALPRPLPVFVRYEDNRGWTFLLLAPGATTR